MVAINQLALLFAAATAAYAAPVDSVERDASAPDFEFNIAGAEKAKRDWNGVTALSKRQDYNQNWNSNSGGYVNYSPTSNGYSVNFGGAGDFGVGKGWTTGSYTRVINFSGSTSHTGGTVLVSLYGWSTNPLVEYYVSDCYIGGSAGQGQQKGSVTSDDSSYTVWLHQQVNQPSIQGTSTFNQYISTRNSQRCGSGTITFANHVNAWKGYGMSLGSPSYQVLATEGWGGASGSSSYSLTAGCKLNQ
jgi:endo-1,4-beta-xylanase